LAVQPPIVAWLEAVVAIGTATAIVSYVDRIVRPTAARPSDDIVRAADAGLGASLVAVACPRSRLMVVDPAGQERKVVQSPSTTRILTRVGALPATGPFGSIVGPATAASSATAIVRAAFTPVAATSTSSAIVGAATAGTVIAATATTTAAVIAATTAAATVIAATPAMIASAMIASTAPTAAVTAAAAATAAAVTTTTTTVASLGRCG
jgi:hypothetical protein